MAPQSRRYWFLIVKQRSRAECVRWRGSLVWARGRGSVQLKVANKKRKVVITPSLVEVVERTLLPVQFSSKSAAVVATVIAGGWTVSMIVINAHPGLQSTPGIWAAVLGLPGVVVGAWIPSRLGDIVALAAMGATNWLFWFAVARTIIAIRRKLFGT